jgi:cytoplasmic iron level regulating protein YaaA (DUF328/UPF0246 family)
MNIRQEILNTIEQLSDEQLAELLPLVLAMKTGKHEAFSSESSQTYQTWLSAENDIYDQIFADELAALQL